MENSVTPPKCPGCQQPLAPGRAQGLCPRCLLARAALATDTAGDRPAAEVPEQSAVAAAFPQLDVLELVGRGGMGVVYKARQKSLNRLVALKLLAPERIIDPQFAGGFEREAQALAQLSHPNIVTIHDFGVATPPGTPDAPPYPPFYFLLMEFVDRVNLRQALQAGRFGPSRANADHGAAPRLVAAAEQKLGLVTDGGLGHGIPFLVAAGADVRRLILKCGVRISECGIEISLLTSAPAVG